jgi:benzil reductase ((S)-benzoin forming)
LTEVSALVAGASSGIGAATALASRGIDVVAVARTPQRLTEHERFPRLRDRLHLVEADLTRPEEVESAFARAAEAVAPLRYVIHSVGFHHRVGWYRETTPTDILDEVSALVASPALVLRQALRAFHSGGGNIGLISSGAANRTTPGRSLYSPSKIALNRLVESVATECAADSPDIGVFAVLPGRVDTPAQRRLVESAHHAHPVFGLERFRSTVEVIPADAVGTAIASLLLRPASELNGRILRYAPDGWLDAGG